MMKKLMVGSLFLMLCCVFPHMGFAIGTPNVLLTWTTQLPANSFVNQSYDVVLNIQNQSTGDVHVTIQSVNTIATNLTDFTLTDTFKCVGSTLFSGKSCNLTWTYKPQSVGNKSLVAVVNYNRTSSVSSQTTSLSRNLSVQWTSNLPSGALAATSGGTSQTVEVTYTNNNSDTVTFTPEVTFTSNREPDTDDFTKTMSTCEMTSTLVAGASCTISYKYAPLTAGLKQGFANGTPSSISNAVLYTTNSLEDQFSLPFGLASNGVNVFYKASLVNGNNYVCILGGISLCRPANNATSANPLTGILASDAKVYGQISGLISSNANCASSNSCGLVYYTNDSGALEYKGNAIQNGTNHGGGLSNSANGLAFDGNGNVWQLAQSFNSNTQDSVDMITSEGSLTSYVIGNEGQNNNPFAITLGPNNTMWFTLETGLNNGNVGYNLGSISATNTTIAQYKLSGYSPRALVSDGTYLWVTAYDGEGDGWLLKIDPNSCTPSNTCSVISATEFNSVPDSKQSRPNAVVYDSNYNVFWIAETVYDASNNIMGSNIYRIDISQSADPVVDIYALPENADPRALVIVPSTTSAQTQVYFTEYGADVIGQFSY